MATIDISEINIGRRIRREMGDIDALCRSIEDVGLLQPITLDAENRLIAGRRRIDAFKKLGRDAIPYFRVSLFSEIAQRLKAERDENTCRENFRLDELHAMGKKLEPYLRKEAKQRQAEAGPKRGKGKKRSACGNLPQPVGKSRDEIGSAIGISGRQWQKLDEIMESGDEKLIADTVRTGKVNGVHRRLKVQESAKQIASEPPPLPEGPFRVIVADPPWHYDNRPNDPSHRGAPPYPSMSIEEIKALSVASIAHNDAVLWLWTTNSHLPEAFSVIAAWGFEYKTMLSWIKPKMGLGDWLRGITEHCLMAVRGAPTVVLTNQTTALHAASGRHSAKPVEFYELVETLCPGSKAELFQRLPREGWASHGNESSP